jgi:thiosulfate/3-mercaptopyruvate sulfurtransferase
MSSNLVTTEWLSSHLQDPKIRTVDCRWVLGKPGEGRRQYEAGHIPGAIYLDVDADLSAKTGPGRHPLPDPLDFEKTMSRIGVDADTHVIAYDEGKGAPAPRLWWLLRYFGHGKISVLDGGFTTWAKEGRPATKDMPSVPPCRFLARPSQDWVVDKMAVDRLREKPGVLILDARAPERYRGDVEPIDAQAGHIPGAKNFPFSTVIDSETGKFLSDEALRERFRSLGADQAKEIVCYCGSGVTACTDLLALKIAGWDGKLYEGSWSDWSRDPDLPVERS